MARLPLKLLGLTAVAFYVAHAAYHLDAGHPERLFWACHLATAVIGFGLLLESPVLNVSGVLWLSIGIPMWLIYLATGGELFPTSGLTHLGGLAIGLVGIRRLGLPAGGWWKALLGLGLVQQLSRFWTPVEANVNLAHRVEPGWEGTFPSYPIYLLFLLAICAATFFVVERLLAGLRPADLR